MSTRLPNHELHEALSGQLSWLRSLARHLVSDENEASDLVQDTVLAALDRPPVLDRPLAPWLASVLRRLHFERRRGRGRRNASEEQAAKPESIPGSDEIVERLELTERLVSLVRELPEPYRTAVALRYRDGLEPKQIAQRLGIPAGTIRWRIKTGLDRLRGQLDDERGSRAAWVGLLKPLSEVEVPVPVAPIAATTPVGVGVLLASAVVVVVVLTNLNREQAEVSSTVATVVLPEQSSGHGGSVTNRRSPIPAIGTRVEVGTQKPASEKALSVSSVAPPQTSAMVSATSAFEGRVAGHVLGPDGFPASGVHVAAYSSAPFPLASESPGVGGRDALAESSTNELGEFELLCLPATPIQIRARLTNGLAIISQPLRAGLVLEQGGGEGLVLQLPAQQPEYAFEEERTSEEVTGFAVCELRGQVVRRAGSGRAGSLEGLRVRLRRAYGPTEVALNDGFRVLWRPAEQAEAQTNQAGRFVLSVDLSANQSEVAIEFLQPNGASLGLFPVQLESGALEQSFVLPASAGLRIDLTLDPLETIQPGFVALSNGDGHVLWRSLGEDILSSGTGQLVFEDLPAGEYEVRWFEGLSASHNFENDTIVFLGTRAGLRQVDVALDPGDWRQIRLDRRRLPCIRGQVYIDGDRANRWQIDFIPPPTSSGAPVVGLLSVPLDERGAFLYRAPYEGRFKVRVTTLEGERSMFECSVNVDQAGASLDLELLTCLATGVWNGARPAQDLWLRTPLANGGFWIAAVQIDANGALRIERAAPGVGRLISAASASETQNAATLALVEIPPSGCTDLSAP